MRSFFAIISAVVSIACSGPNESAGDNVPSDVGETREVGDAGGSDSRPDTAGAADATALCGAPNNDAPIVTVETNAPAFEPPKGGAITDGEYHLTRVEIRTGASGARRFVRTIAIKGSAWAEADRDPTTSSEDVQRGAVLSLAAMNLSLEYMCGENQEKKNWVYTAQGTTLFILDAPGTSGSSLLRFTYTLR